MAFNRLTPAASPATSVTLPNNLIYTLKNLNY